MILFHRLIFSLTSQSLSVIVELLCMLLFSRSVMSESLWPNGLQHARLPCPSLSPWVCSNSCLLSWWCHPTILSSVYSLSSCLQFPSIRVFSNESALGIRWSKYCSFSFNISPSKEHSGLIFFRMDWLDQDCVHQDPGTPQRLGQNCVWASPLAVQVISDLPQGQRLWVQQTWVWHKPSWRRSPLTTP